MTSVATISVPTGAPKKTRRPLIPLTFEKRMALGAVLRVPATVEEYIEYLNKCDYKLQYSRGCIWSFMEIDEQTDIIMGEAAPIHEQIIGKLLSRFGLLFDQFDGEYRSYSSNIKVYVARHNSYYNPDMAITKGEPQFIKHKYNKKSATFLLNPYILVEVLSKSTESFDKINKLADYQKIESLEQIIFIEPNNTDISTFIRQSANEWRHLTFDSDTELLPIADKGHILVGDIYKNLIRLNISNLETR